MSFLVLVDGTLGPHRVTMGSEGNISQLEHGDLLCAGEHIKCVVLELMLYYNGGRGCLEEC